MSQKRHRLKQTIAQNMIKDCEMSVYVSLINSSGDISSMNADANFRPNAKFQKVATQPVCLRFWKCISLLYGIPANQQQTTIMPRLSIIMMKAVRVTISILNAVITTQSVITKTQSTACTRTNRVIIIQLLFLINLMY